MKNKNIIDFLPLQVYKIDKKLTHTELIESQLNIKRLLNHAENDLFYELHKFFIENDLPIDSFKYFFTYSFYYERIKEKKPYHIYIKKIEVESKILNLKKEEGEDVSFFIQVSLEALPNE